MSKLLTVEGLVGARLSFHKQDMRVVTINDDAARTVRLVSKKSAHTVDVPLSWLQDGIRYGVINET